MFTAYVPVGSLAKGEALVNKGGPGKTFPMRPVPWSGPQGARSFAEHRRPLAKLHVSPALRLRACRADRRVEPPNGTGGEQPRAERHAGDCSLSCFTRPVTRLSICPIGASGEGRPCGNGAEAHSKRRPRRQLSNEVCCGTLFGLARLSARVQGVPPNLDRNRYRRRSTCEP
jgi:hypothetical protein